MLTTTCIVCERHSDFWNETRNISTLGLNARRLNGRDVGVLLDWKRMESEALTTTSLGSSVACPPEVTITANRSPQTPGTTAVSQSAGDWLAIVKAKCRRGAVLIAVCSSDRFAACFGILRPTSSSCMFRNYISSVDQTIDKVRLQRDERD